MKIIVIPHTFDSLIHYRNIKILLSFMELFLCLIVICRKRNFTQNTSINHKKQLENSTKSRWKTKNHGNYLANELSVLCIAVEAWNVSKPDIDQILKCIVVITWMNFSRYHFKNCSFKCIRLSKMSDKLTESLPRRSRVCWNNVKWHEKYQKVNTIMSWWIHSVGMIGEWESEVKCEWMQNVMMMISE